MNCDIVRDLMPGYIDGVISEAGSSAVMEHLDECGECRRFFSEMKEDMADKSTPQERAALDGFKKIRSRTRYLKAAAALGGLLLAALVIGVFLKVYVAGSLLEQGAVMISSAEYDEETDSLTVKGYMTYASCRISRVEWKENPSIGARVDLFVYAAETLPFGKEQQDFSITIPDMKGKVLYIVGSDYDNFRIYDWNNDHIGLLSELEDEIYTRVNPSWDREKVLLSPVQGLRIVDGVEGIEYGVTFLSGDDPGYWKLGYTIVMHGDIEEAGYHIWISLEEPHQILIYDFSTGEYRRPETLDYEFFQF